MSAPVQFAAPPSEGFAPVSPSFSPTAPGAIVPYSPSPITSGPSPDVIDGELIDPPPRPTNSPPSNTNIPRAVEVPQPSSSPVNSTGGGSFRPSPSSTPTGGGWRNAPWNSRAAGAAGAALDAMNALNNIAQGAPAAGEIGSFAGGLAGGAVGTAIGGPIGGIIGAGLGSLLGRNLGNFLFPPPLDPTQSPSQKPIPVNLPPQGIANDAVYSITIQQEAFNAQKGQWQGTDPWNYSVASTYGINLANAISVAMASFDNQNFRATGVQVALAYPGSEPNYQPDIPPYPGVKPDNLAPMGMPTLPDGTPYPAPRLYPSPRPAPAPTGSPSPSPAPTGSPAPSPVPTPTGSPAPSPAPAPTPSPSPSPSPSGSPGSSGGTSGSTSTVPSPVPFPDPATTSSYRFDTVFQKPPSPGDCCCKFKPVETEKVKVKVFEKCEKDDKGDLKPKFTEKEVLVLKGTTSETKNLHERIAEIEAQQCSSKPDALLVPEWWQVRLGNRPQAVVTWQEVKDDGKLGDSKWIMSIPHYNKPRDFKPKFQTYVKGDWEVQITLKDNSKILFNAKDKAQAKKLIPTLLSLIPQDMKQSARIRQGERPKTYKQAKVKAVRITYYSKGQENLNPDWTIKL